VFTRPIVRRHPRAPDPIASGSPGCG
jgi:hypothetical protein